MDSPVPPTAEFPLFLKFLPALNSLLSIPAPFEFILHEKFGGWEGRWFDDPD